MKDQALARVFLEVRDQKNKVEQLKGAMQLKNAEIERVQLEARYQMNEVAWLKKALQQKDTDMERVQREACKPKNELAISEMKHALRIKERMIHIYETREQTGRQNLVMGVELSQLKRKESTKNKRRRIGITQTLHIDSKCCNLYEM